MIDSKHFHLCFQWKKCDLWIGAYYENRLDSFNLWICLLSTIAFHVRIPKEF